MMSFRLMLFVLSVFFISAYAMDAQAGDAVLNLDRRGSQDETRRDSGPFALTFLETLMPQPRGGGEQYSPPDAAAQALQTLNKKDGAVNTMPVIEGIGKTDLEEGPSGAFNQKGLPGKDLTRPGEEKVKVLPEGMRFKGPLFGRGDDFGSRFLMDGKEDVPFDPEDQTSFIPSDDSIGLGGTWRKGGGTKDADAGQKEDQGLGPGWPGKKQASDSDGNNQKEQNQSGYFGQDQDTGSKDRGLKDLKAVSLLEKKKNSIRQGGLLEPGSGPLE